MSLVYSRTDSGLTVAEHGQDEAAVARALKQHDPDLRLVRQPDPSSGMVRWCVYRYAGSERPAEFLVGWTNEYGEPLPLSMRLLDKVQQHDRNLRGHITDADTANREFQERRDQADREATEAIIDDWRPRAEKGRIWTFHKSPALAAARRRGRRKGVSG